MKNYFQLVTTKGLTDFGVALFDSHSDSIAHHFDGFKKRDAQNVCGFCNDILQTVKKNVQIHTKLFAKVIRVAKKYYVVKEIDIAGGVLIVSSHGFKNATAACRCAAIAEMIFQGGGDSDDV